MGARLRSHTVGCKKQSRVENGVAGVGREVSLAADTDLHSTHIGAVRHGLFDDVFRTREKATGIVGAPLPVTQGGVPESVAATTWHGPAFSE